MQTDAPLGNPYSFRDGRQKYFNLHAAGYFPFVYAIMMTLFGGNILNYLFGILLGHAYIFVKDIALVRYHKDYLPTPRWFSNWWFGRQGEGPRARGNGGAFQGQGVRLD